MRAYSGTGPSAVVYANRVIADAHRYQAGGVLLAGVGCDAAAQGRYANPFARAAA